jgi:ankyrin repeat protein
MVKSYYKTIEGLAYSLYNIYDEDKVIADFQDIELEIFNQKNEHEKSLGIIALEIGKNKVFKYLVDIGIDLTIKNSSGRDLLFISTMRNNYESAKLLLENYNFKETISETLDYAVLPISSQNIEIIKLLIIKGGRLSEYHLNYLFNISNDNELKYDREDIRAFYLDHALGNTKQFSMNIEQANNSILPNSTNQVEDQKVSGDNSLLEIDDSVSTFLL